MMRRNQIGRFQRLARQSLVLLVSIYPFSLFPIRLVSLVWVLFARLTLSVYLLGSYPYSIVMSVRLSHMTDIIKATRR